MMKLVAVMAAAGLLLPSAAMEAQTAPAMHWVGAWACATQQLYKTDTSSYQEFKDQTARAFVHPTLGGKTLRVRLSNAYGSNEAVVDGATIGLRGNGTAIQGGTIHAITMNGRTKFTLPQGATFWSDPIPMEFAAFQDLVVSLHLPDFSGNIETGHSRSAENNLILAGDQTHAETVIEDASTKKTQSNYFLEAIDVAADSHTYAIVAIGDSITDGVQSTRGANKRWPDVLAERLAATHGVVTNGVFSVLNAGISGNRILHDGTGPNTFTRLSRDVLRQPGAKVVILLEGINDINSNRKATPGQMSSVDDITGAYQQLAQQIHSAGMKFVVGTILPEKGAESYTDAGEVQRKAVNSWIRSSKLLDGVIDFDAAIRDPQDPTKMLEAYSSVDHIHPSDAGYKAMADAIQLPAFLGAYFTNESLAVKGK